MRTPWEAGVFVYRDDRILLMHRTEDRYWHYDYPADLREVTVYTFVARAPAGWEPTLNEEHDEYRWTTFDEATSLLYWPEAREAVRLLAIRLAGPA